MTGAREEQERLDRGQDGQARKQTGEGEKRKALSVGVWCACSSEERTAMERHVFALSAPLLRVVRGIATICGVDACCTNACLYMYLHRDVPAKQEAYECDSMRACSCVCAPQRKPERTLECEEQHDTGGRQTAAPSPRLCRMEREGGRERGRKGTGSGARENPCGWTSAIHQRKLCWHTAEQVNCVERCRQQEDVAHNWMYLQGPGGGEEAGWKECGRAGETEEKSAGGGAMEERGRRKNEERNRGGGRKEERVEGEKKGRVEERNEWDTQGTDGAAPSYAKGTGHRLDEVCWYAYGDSQRNPQMRKCGQGGSRRQGRRIHARCLSNGLQDAGSMREKGMAQRCVDDTETCVLSKYRNPRRALCNKHGMLHRRVGSMSEVMEGQLGSEYFRLICHGLCLPSSFHVIVTACKSEESHVRDRENDESESSSWRRNHIMLACHAMT